MLPRENPMLKRRVTRMYALQVLYQLSYVPSHSITDTIEQFLLNYENQNFSKVDIDFLHTLVDGVQTHQEQINNILTPIIARKWNDTEEILLIILQLACYEILHNPEVQLAVILSINFNS